MANTYRQTGEAPSGRTYVYRGLNPFEAAEVYGGIVTLAEVSLEASPLDLTMDEVQQAEQVCRAIVTRGTIAPRIVEKEDPADPAAVPFAELGADMVWLQRAIMDATGLTGKDADEARRFRGKRRQLRPAPRRGKGQRRKAK